MKKNTWRKNILSKGPASFLKIQSGTVFSPCLCKYRYKYIRLRHMRRAIARTCLRTRLKHWRRAKKSKPCLIKIASRRVADRTSKTTTFIIFHFLWNTKILGENHVICYFIDSMVKIVLPEASTGGFQWCLPAVQIWHF